MVNDDMKTETRLKGYIIPNIRVHLYIDILIMESVALVLVLVLGLVFKLLYNKHCNKSLV